MHSRRVSQSELEWRKGAWTISPFGWLRWVSDSRLQYVGEAVVKGHDFMWLWFSGTLIKTKLQFRVLDNLWLALCHPYMWQHLCIHWHNACSSFHPLSRLRSQRARGLVFMWTRAIQPASFSQSRLSMRSQGRNVSTCVEKRFSMILNIENCVVALNCFVNQHEEYPASLIVYVLWEALSWKHQKGKPQSCILRVAVLKTI